MVPDPLITCAPVPGILHEGTTPLRLLRTVKALAGDGEVALTLAKGARCTFWALTGTEQAWVTLRTDPVVVMVPLDTLGVDLTDFTGRTHTLDHLAGLAGIKGNVTPVLSTSVPMGVLWTCLPWPAWLMQTWQCTVDRDHHRRFVAPGKGGLSGDVELEALTHLDPTDDTRLEDGSRVVDAQVLAAVALHYLTAPEPAP